LPPFYQAPNSWSTKCAGPVDTTQQSVLPKTQRQIVMATACAAICLHDVHHTSYGVDLETCIFYSVGLLFSSFPTPDSLPPFVSRGSWTYVCLCFPPLLYTGRCNKFRLSFLV